MDGLKLKPRLLRTYKWNQPYSKYNFQKSLNTEAIPNDWKTAHVVPIYRKGPKYNYIVHTLKSLYMYTLKSLFVYILKSLFVYILKCLFVYTLKSFSVHTSKSICVHT